MTILVTGTGGGAGQSVLKSLQHTNYRVIAADGEVLGAGLYTTGRGYLLPYANKPEYADRLLEICQTERVQVLFPGLDAELPVLARVRDRFAAIGTTLVVSEANIVSICDDKLLTANFLHDNGFPFPKTWLLADFPADDIPFPLVLKPKEGGARSKGVCLVRTNDELRRARRDYDNTAFVAQELIEGPEYTCGTVTLNGNCRGSIVMRRILRDGDTYKAFVERKETLETFVCDVANRLKPFGPCNFQLRVRDGVPYIFEFNGRCSGTTYCRTLAGFNEPKMIVDFIINAKEPEFHINEITILRYWKELVVPNNLISECDSTGEVRTRASPL